MSCCRNVKLAALYSGGKDSTYAAYIMEQQGHEVESLISIIPDNKDSWMFHTPNLSIIPLMAEAMGKKHLSVKSYGDEGGELDALRSVLETLDADGIVTGAIASDYQWDRINHVCEDLGLKVFSPLWRKDPLMLMESMIESGIKAIIATVAAEGLDRSWLGRELNLETLDGLKKLNDRYSVSVSGEGGEYESLTLDSPMHKKAVMLESCEITESRDCARMEVKSAKLVEKESSAHI